MPCDCYQFGLLVEVRNGYELTNGDGTYEPVEWGDWSGTTYDAEDLDTTSPFFPTIGTLGGFAAETTDTNYSKFHFDIRLTLKHSKIPVKVTWDVYGDDLADPTPGLGTNDSTLISQEEQTLNSGTPTYTISFAAPAQTERHVKNLVIKPCPWHV
jgi:hypothetical protein